MLYKIKIDQEALIDLQEIIVWYNNQAQSLGARFFKQTSSQLNILKKTPLIFSTRYDDVRCMIIKKFPFMVHYKIDPIQKKILFLLFFILVEIQKFGKVEIRRIEHLGVRLQVAPRLRNSR